MAKKKSNVNIVTPVTAISAETEQVTLNKPGSIYEAVKQGIREAGKQEEHPAETPFRQNGR